MTIITPPSIQHDSTSNLEDLLDEYESYWVINHGIDMDSSSGLEGSNMSPSHETVVVKYEIHNTLQFALDCLKN